MISEDETINRENLKKLKNRVWQTKKIRMEAEERRINLKNQFSLVLNGATILALLISVTALIPNLILSNNSMTILSIAISIGVMVTSLLITGYSFIENANQFRQSYLNLDELENEIQDEISKTHCDGETVAKLESKYNQIQSETLNHNNMDYVYFKVGQFHNKKKQINKDEEKVSVGLVEWIEFFVSKYSLNLIFILLVVGIIGITVDAVINA